MAPLVGEGPCQAVEEDKFICRRRGLSDRLGGDVVFCRLTGGQQCGHANGQSEQAKHVREDPQGR